MQTTVLLSIKPEFAQEIFLGKKKFEFRKTIFKDKEIKKVYVYASSPTCRVIGEFEIEDILTCEPKSLWEKTKKYSGITKKYFSKYFNGKDIGHAIKISSTIHYHNPPTLMEMFGINRPPQSFMYIRNDILNQHNKVNVNCMNDYRKTFADAHYMVQTS